MEGTQLHCPKRFLVSLGNKKKSQNSTFLVLKYLARTLFSYKSQKKSVWVVLQYNLHTARFAVIFALWVCVGFVVLWFFWFCFCFFYFFSPSSCQLELLCLGMSGLWKACAFAAATAIAQLMLSDLPVLIRPGRILTLCLLVSQTFIAE